eukprot:3093583-Rhodomonas_salina.1
MRQPSVDEDERRREEHERRRLRGQRRWQHQQVVAVHAVVLRGLVDGAEPDVMLGSRPCARVRCVGSNIVAAADRRADCGGDGTLHVAVPARSRVVAPAHD